MSTCMTIWSALDNVAEPAVTYVIGLNVSRFANSGNPYKLIIPICLKDGQLRLITNKEKLHHVMIRFRPLEERGIYCQCD